MLGQVGDGVEIGFGCWFEFVGEQFGSVFYVVGFFGFVDFFVGGQIGFVYFVDVGEQFVFFGCVQGCFDLFLQFVGFFDGQGCGWCEIFYQ